LSISSEVVKETKNDLDRLDWPSSYKSRIKETNEFLLFICKIIKNTLSLSEFVSLRSSSDATSEMGEGNTSLSVDNSLKISLGIFKVHSLDCSDNFEGILEVNSEISCRGLNSCDQNKNELAFCFIMFSIRSRAMAGLFACCVV